jgi:hypothetical protein
MSRGEAASPLTLNALALMGECDGQGEVLDRLQLDSAADRFRVEVVKAMRALTMRQSPDLVALSSSATGADQAVPGGDPTPGMIVAYLRACEGARVGGDAPALLAAAARSVTPLELPWDYRLAVWPLVEPLSLRLGLLRLRGLP